MIVITESRQGRGKVAESMFPYRMSDFKDHTEILMNFSKFYDNDLYYELLAVTSEESNRDCAFLSEKEFEVVVQFLEVNGVPYKLGVEERSD